MQLQVLHYLSERFAGRGTKFLLDLTRYFTTTGVQPVLHLGGNALAWITKVETQYRGTRPGTGKGVQGA